MNPDPAAFLSWANNRWTEQRFNLLETPAQFAAREPAWFLKDLASEWKAHRKALLAALRPERAKLEARCIELAHAIGLAVADVRKHRYRPSYSDFPTSLRVDGKLSRAKLRTTRTRTNRESGVVKDLVTFSDSWTRALARFVDEPLACAPIEALGFPLESREVPDLNQVLSKVPAARSWSWGGLYPARLLKLWATKNKWPDDTPWPLLVWGDAFDRMLTRLGQLHSDVAMSPSSLLVALDLTLRQPSLADYVGLPSVDGTTLAGWQVQLQGRYKGWLLAKLGRSNPKQLSHLYPLGIHAIKHHRSPDGQPLLGPMVSTLQATTWFVGFTLAGLVDAMRAVAPGSVRKSAGTRKPTRNRLEGKRFEAAVDAIATGKADTAAGVARIVGVHRKTVGENEVLRDMLKKAKQLRKGHKFDGMTEGYDDPERDEKPEDDES